MVFFFRNKRSYFQESNKYFCHVQEFDGLICGEVKLRLVVELYLGQHIPNRLILSVQCMHFLSSIDKILFACMALEDIQML